MLTTVADVVVVGGFPTGLVSLAVVFFVVALLAYALGAKGMAGMSAGIGRTLLIVFLILAVLSAVFAFR